MSDFINMCGIFGFLDIDSSSVLQAGTHILERMGQSLKHRGPDENGFYCDNFAYLGHCRLSIIDLATGKQPIHNEDGSLWIIFNGEIYNFIALRNELIQKGHRFYTRSDTEVILHLYEEEGEECVKKLDGMFAFCIWDKINRKFFLARDPVGKKPLHWFCDGKKFIFASELKAILEFPGFSRSIDTDSLGKYFLFGFVPAPKSIFKNVNKLLPGSSMSVGVDGSIKERTYWQLDYSDKLVACDAGGIRGRVIHLLENSVNKRLISDVPLGVFLSGGVDSSLVTAIMARLVDPSQIHAFSIGFKEKDVDESFYAQMVAKHLKVNHHLKLFSQNEVFKLVPKIADFLDEPLADPSIMPTYLLSAFTREKVKVALSGDGGDENFGGYPKYLAQLLLGKSRLDKISFACMGKLLKGRLGTFLRYSGLPLHKRNQLWISHIPLENIDGLLGKKIDYFNDLEFYHSLFNGTHPADEALFIDQKMTLPDMYLVKADRASMAASLEVRSPFLDKEVMNFSARIPIDLKLKGFKTKSLLKEIASAVLPKKAVYRKKMGFGIPLSSWLRLELKPLVMELANFNKIKKEGLLDPGITDRIIKGNNSNQVWNLLVFELWHDKWMKS